MLQFTAKMWAVSHSITLSVWCLWSKILPCSVEFKLQNGVYDGDPYFRNNKTHIDTC